jgi:hypothetical protein
MTIHFPRTAAAIAQYDATEPQRDALFRQICRNGQESDFVAWDKAVKEAREALAQAFFADTSHINTIDDCRRMPVSRLRELVGADVFPPRF